tara:strand:+ start:874 stop:1005 length:132 start_codon:yes stop_codon:yes gene_type:complete
LNPRPSGYEPVEDLQEIAELEKEASDLQEKIHSLTGTEDATIK